METRNKRLIPSRATHPGSILIRELKSREISQKDFAQSIGLPASRLNEIIKGKRDITPEIAISLEQVLGIPYKFWMDMQAGYHYDLQAISERDQEEQEACKKEEGYKEIYNLTAIYNSLGIVWGRAMSRLEELRRLLGLKEEDELPSLAGLFKRSNKLKIDERNARTWVLLAEIAFRQKERPSGRYEQGMGIKVAQEIANHANAGTLTTKQIEEILGANGIVYVHVSKNKLERAPIDAFSSICQGIPCIAVTYRIDDIDKLAFDVIHELCHIDKHLDTGQERTCFINIEGLDYEADKQEREANTFAQNALIPPQIWRSIWKTAIERGQKSPHATITQIAENAKAQGIKPSIAVARYKREVNVYNVSSHRSGRIQ